MIRNICILAFSFFTIFICGQEVTFQKNPNRSARILEQDLNKNKDSLIFKSEKLIRQVDIFNNDYMNTIVVNDNEAKIEIGSLPLGEFIIQARLGRKRIIMYLLKSEPVAREVDKIEQPVVVSTERNRPEYDNTNLLNRKSISNPDEEPSTFYWVVYEYNTYAGSSKTMSMETEAEVDKLIARNKLELSTEIAKNNTLIVYEVYDTLKFMRKQLTEPDFFKSSNSTVFNVIPYYKSENLKLADN